MDELKYDSTVDTTIHQNNVKEVWEIVKMIMDEKIQDHDMSKLLPPEKECYDTYIPQLKQVQYGTEEYYAIRKKMQEEGLDHHYKVNRHHPEHFPNGISGMDLFDFLEHVIDCYAASLVSDTKFQDGLANNTKRFSYPPELVSMLEQTAKRLDYMYKSVSTPHIF